MQRYKLWSLVVLLGLLVTGPAAPAFADRQEVTRAETLKIAIPAQITDPTNLNIYAAGSDRSATGLHQFIYEYFFYNNLQTGEFIPWLAESYEYSTDNTSMTVKLRDGVTWSDGQPFTADDVVFTYELLAKNPGMGNSAEVTKAVKSVEKVDSLNVKINLITGNPRFHLNREAFPAVGIWGALTILPKHIWEKEADPLTFKNSDPVGTGPYRVRDASQNGVTLERRDDWWGTKVFEVTPAPRFVQFTFVGDEQNVALALSNNDLDAAWIGLLSAGTFQQVAAQNPNVRAWTQELPFAWPDPCPRGLMINNDNPPFDKPEVRQALSHLIDRQAVVDLAYEGTTTPAWNIWPEYDGNVPYSEAIADIHEQYPIDTFDPARAEELLASVGLQPSDITVRYVVNADNVEEQKNSQVIADQLTAAGINVEVQPLTGNANADARLKGDFDMTQQPFCPGYPVENLELFHSKYYVPLGESAPWFERNSFRYNNPEFDALVDQMLALPPDATDQILPIFHDAMAIWYRDLPIIPLVETPALVPFNFTYWEGWPTSEDPWNMPVTWWATTGLVVTGYPDPATGEWVGGLEPAGG